LNKTLTRLDTHSAARALSELVRGNSLSWGCLDLKTDYASLELNSLQKIILYLTSYKGEVKNTIHDES